MGSNTAGTMASGSGYHQIVGPGVVHGHAFAYYSESPPLSGSPPPQVRQSVLAPRLPPLVPVGMLPGESVYTSPRHQQQMVVVGSPPAGADVRGEEVMAAVDSRNVYIRNLPEECTDAVLSCMASPYGSIESSKSIIDEETGKCKGYGFVKYRTAEQAGAAIMAFNAQGFHSTLARDSFKSKLKRLQDKSSANVYVSNLSADIDETALVELISPYPVVSARILRDSHTGQHKGAGFARMPDRDTALLVIEKLKNIRLVNAPGPLQPRIADSSRQKQLKKQVNGEGGGRFDDGSGLRSGATSPLVWSPVLVYSPGASSPPHSPLHGFELPTTFIPAYASGFGSPGYASPGYASPGYASPVHLPASPQLAYAHVADHPYGVYGVQPGDMSFANDNTLPRRRRPHQHMANSGLDYRGTAPPQPTHSENAANDLAAAIQDKLAI